MKCFVAVLFLVAVAVGEHCTPPEKYTAEYFLDSAFDKSGYHVSFGKMMKDLTGRRTWISYDSDIKKGEALFLFNENKMYMTSNDHCVEMHVPDNSWIYILKQMHTKLPKDAKLVTSGHIADSNLRVNYYGGALKKDGRKVGTYVVSQTDKSCVIVSTTYVLHKVAAVKINLFEVKMGIDEGKFVPPKDCRKSSPQAAANDPSYRLFR